MSIQQNIATGATGLGAWLLSTVGILQPVVGVLVGLVTLVALGYSIHLKRKQILFINKDLDK